MSDETERIIITGTIVVWGFTISILLAAIVDKLTILINLLTP